MKKTIHAADLFCGAGGTSTGLVQACRDLGLNLKLTAVNHWETAIETHSKNHPDAEHFVTDLGNLKPIKAVPKGKLDLLIASPECTHHSKARGGRPACDQSRASAWHILHWCQELYVRNVMIENVPEFASWGPLGANGKPLKSKRGETFLAFVGALRSLGYRTDWRILNCADHGDPTTRERFFMIASRGRKKLCWPAVKFGKNSSLDMFGEALKPWRAAREIIDWSDLGHSIFMGRDEASRIGIRRPLSENTMKRIEAGVMRFCGEFAEPFLIMLRGTSEYSLMNSIRSVDLPLPALTTSCSHNCLCTPFVLNQQAGGENKPVDSPIPTLTATGAHAIISPYLVKYYGQGENVASVNMPVGAVTTVDQFGLVSNILMRMLKPEELAAAHSFPVDYHFAGTKKDILKQIGNSVPVLTAKALCKSLLGNQ